jgi:hypothetical protein
MAIFVMVYLMLLKFRGRDIPERGPWSVFTLKRNFTWQIAPEQIERSGEQRLGKGLQERRAA